MSVGWTAEWRTGLRRRRLLALNVAVPLLLVAALVVGGAPAAHAAAAVTVLFTIFGVFGSAIPLVRDGEDGLLLRWLLAGVAPRTWVGGRLAAQAALDMLALLPSVVLLAWGATGGTGEAVVRLLVPLGLTLVVANALGAWLAAAARSLAEAALFGAVVALLLLHLAGVFRTPTAGSWQAAAEACIPFRLLHEALLETLGVGVGTGGIGAWPPALSVAAVFLLLTWLAAPALLGRLSSPEGAPV